MQRKYTFKVYSLKDNTVVWYWGNEKKELQTKGLIQVGYYPKIDKIMVLLEDEKQGLEAYNIKGKREWISYAPVGYRMEYLQEHNRNVSVVCDGGKNADKYGRSRFNFELDISNGSMVKKSVGY